MSIQQLAIVGAAVALVFGPQLVEAAKAIVRHRGADPAAGTVFDRSAAVATLLRLQGQMSAAGLAGAADLAGRLLVELVTEGKAPPAGGKK